jgi:hypothetical protein
MTDAASDIAVVGSPSSFRAALYLRVSTGRQAESNLSNPDQRRQSEAYCGLKGWHVVAEYVEPGASETDDRRPEFQRLIDAASVKPSAFDVSSFSLLPGSVPARVPRPEAGQEQCPARLDHPGARRWKRRRSECPVIPKWRAVMDENEYYVFAIAL